MKIRGKTMNINVKGRIKVPFKNLKLGVVFEFDGKYYMRTMEIKIGEFDNTKINAVNIESGELLCFRDDAEVVSVKCELTIEM